MKRHIGLTSGLAISALLAACSTPEYVRPKVDLPDRWRTAATEERSLTDMPWAQLFRSSELEALVREALKNNSDLRIAAERVEIARAQYGIQRAALYPSVTAGASDTRARQPSYASPTSNGVGQTVSVGLNVPSWEIDLWGRVRSLNDAALRSLNASDETRRAAQSSLIAQVALTYLNLLELDAQLDVAKRTERTRRESLRLVRLRFENGTVSAVDLQQAMSILAGAEVTVADLERQRALGENTLSLLVGRNAGPIAREAKLTDFVMPSQLPAGLPSQLIERRPDVRSAEQTLASMDANVNAAKKAFFPTISLTGFLGFISPEFAGLFSSDRYAWSVGPAVNVPIFNSGRLTANVEVAEAQQRVALEQYRLSIRTAFKEVEDALISYNRLREQLEAQTRMTVADRERLRLTRLRYDNGVSSYFEVLDSERQAFSSELIQVQTTRAVYASVVQLYRTLGGG